MMAIRIKACELRLADTITVTGDGPFTTCIVTNIKDGQVHLFRPYGTTSDFSYTGGVIPYIGIEQYSIPADDFEVTVWLRKELH